MKLSISEVATVLGKSERQVRYLIRKGELRAVKEGKKWAVASDDLPLDEGRKARLGERLAAARRALEDGLEPAAKALASGTGTGGGKETKSEHYSVTRLTAFESGAEIYRQLVQELGDAAPARPYLIDALVEITRGCHRFHAEAKARSFGRARELTAAAVTHLLVAADDDGRCRRLAGRLEQELIPKLSGLVAANEKGRRRSRFERFGAGGKGRS